VTRFTWPVFAGAPFAPLFAAVAATSHWGSGPAGLAAVALATLMAPLAFPPTWNPYTLMGFIPVAVIGSRLIAARNRAVAALRASESQLRATWEHSTLGAALLDGAGRVERINPALERLLGYTSAAAQGMPMSGFSPLDEAAQAQQRFAAFISGGGDFYQRKQQYRRQDGSLFWGHVTVSAIGGRHGRRTGALLVLEDVTAQHQAELDVRASEERLRRAQKMEAVGQLVAGVAHNFNNLLTVTMGYTDILMEPHGDEALNQTAVHEIRKATERGAALTRQLLAFGRKHDPRLARIDLNRTLAGLAETLTRVIREDIQLTVDLDNSAPAAVVIDPHDFEQVIFNLVINARDALPDGGRIHLDVTRQTIDAANAPPDQAVTLGEYVRFRVTDDGIGMSAEVQAHLFEPFFTTKEVGEGTGMGLAFVHGIARHGRGFVTVRSAPGKGTTVAVYLPPAPEVAAEPPAVVAAPAARERAPGATVLLVEDETAVRTMTAQMLQRAGYRVLSAGTPGQACSLFDEHEHDIDLLVTDVVMPEMHGPVLAERLVARRPDLRVLFVSGYSDAMPASAVASTTVSFLPKPFAPSRLVTAVADLLMAGAT
jgi:two-component system, cell cycle sensor histidine kinase and response regulator CckA